MFSAGEDLAPVTHQPVAVAAVNTVHFFNGVEIGEFVAIDHDVIAPAYQRNAVNTKAHAVVNADEQIHQHHREEHAVDNRRGEDVANARAAQVAQAVDAVAAVQVADLTAEATSIAMI